MISFLKKKKPKKFHFKTVPKHLLSFYSQLSLTILHGVMLYTTPTFSSHPTKVRNMVLYNIGFRGIGGNERVV
jgi:hypothetical protein